MAVKTVMSKLKEELEIWLRDWDRYDKEGIEKPISYDELFEKYIKLEAEQLIRFASFCRAEEREINWRGPTSTLEMYNNVYTDNIKHNNYEARNYKCNCGKEIKEYVHDNNLQYYEFTCKECSQKVNYLNLIKEQKSNDI